jgi:bifunctional non-homologous end joining protein LigD
MMITAAKIIPKKIPPSIGGLEKIRLDKLLMWVEDGSNLLAISNRAGLIQEENFKYIAEMTRQSADNSNSAKKYSGKLTGEKIFVFGKSKVKVTHLDKIFFPEDSISKGDVIKYYMSMSAFILPYLKGRPQSLFRNPDGINGKGFFQKDAGGNVPSFVRGKMIFSESTEKEVNYIVCDNLATLIYLNNLGCIEIHPWHSTIKSLDKPDYMIIDLDPSEKNTFDQVIEVAIIVKKILDKAGAPSYCKTSGSSGIHVYVPMGKKYNYEQVKEFAHKICSLVNNELRDFTTLERNLEKRDSKHIYLDYLQNSIGQTIASVYSLRPRRGAIVSTPLKWEEVKKGLTPQLFTIHNMKKRVSKTGDIFKGILGKGIDLHKCHMRLDA